MDGNYKEMFNELVAAVDKGYVFAKRITNGEIKNPPSFADNKNYMNGVTGAYMAMEDHIDHIYEKHKVERKT